MYLPAMSLAGFASLRSHSLIEPSCREECANYGQGNTGVSLGGQIEWVILDLIKWPLYGGGLF